MPSIWRAGSNLGMCTTRIGIRTMTAVLGVLGFRLVNATDRMVVNASGDMLTYG